MVKVYTKKKWMEFKEEMSRSHDYFVQPASTRDETDDIVIYNVMSFQICSSSKPRLLVHDIRRDHISCNCGKFEFDGIPCRHMLAFFRWTREVNVGVVYTMDDENANDDPTNFLVSRRSKLSYKVSILIDDASLTNEETKFLDEQLDYPHGNIRDE